MVDYKKIYSSEKQVQNVLEAVSQMKASLDSLEKKIGSAQLSCYYKDLYGDLQSLSEIKNQEDELAKLIKKQEEQKQRRAEKERERKDKEDARNQLLSAAIRRRTSQPRWH